MPVARHRDGTAWETVAGYSRAVRRGSRIAVSGTTASAADGTALHPGDTAAQTEEALRRAIAGLRALGGRPSDVLRTRVFLTPDADWREAARVHAEMLGDVAPANTMVHVAALIGDGLLVEVELDAELGPQA